MSARRLLQALFVAPATLLAGCAADPSGTPGETVATTAEAVVGGYVTTARPEIGIVVVGGGCTGTLISPRAVVTSSQCLSPAYTGTTAPPGSFFRLTDVVGGVHDYGIDDVWSFYPEGDVALVHLAAAVPASQALPATVVEQEPAIGTASTYFGYGCPDFGTKRFYWLVYGQTTNQLCGGDAGAPAVLGYGNGPSTIWGITTSGQPDVLVPLWYFKTQIDAKLRAWDDAYAGQNVDRPGSDYAAFSSRSPATCNGSCDADAQCQAWAWVASTYECWLKDAVPAPVPDPGVTSGTPHAFAANYDRAGNDVAIWNNVGSAEDCQMECQMRQFDWCESWTWDPATQACHLKNTVQASVYSPGKYSGVFDRAYEVGFDRPGGDLRQLQTTSADDCGWSCGRDWRCRAFVWSSTSNTCWLKDAVTPQVPSPQLTSGVRRGMRVGFMHGGVAPTSGFPVDTTVLYPAPSAAAASSPSLANPFVCQSACLGTQWCHAWNLVLLDHRGWCELFADPTTLHAPASYPAPRTITGVRELEFVP